MREDSYKNFVLATFVLVSFVILVSFISFYVKNISRNSCFCGLPLWLGILLISLLGLFIGSFIYYILNRHYITEKHKSEKAILKTLSFLENDEKEVIKTILNFSGEITQRKLCELTGFNKVKISRILNKFENKKIIQREKYGMTNKIILDKELLGLFIELK
ncbi:MAG: hypothetical protein B6U88_01710 [Candidatus Aenigmarchaeota archaeon ex4484_56]|nr:MAG: hypothetical protein B6U88_01710 [Candidatus Aenigmarchaeota archaeon ex4484_56]